MSRLFQRRVTVTTTAIDRRMAVRTVVRGGWAAASTAPKPGPLGPVPRGAPAMVTTAGAGSGARAKRALCRCSQRCSRTERRVPRRPSSISALPMVCPAPAVTPSRKAFCPVTAAAPMRYGSTGTAGMKAEVSAIRKVAIPASIMIRPRSCGPGPAAVPPPGIRP